MKFYQIVYEGHEPDELKNLFDVKNSLLGEVTANHPNLNVS